MAEGAFALAPVIAGVAIGASALTFIAFWAFEQRHKGTQRWWAFAAVPIAAALYGVWVWSALIAPRIIAFPTQTVTLQNWSGPPMTIAIVAALNLGPNGRSTQEAQRLIAQINQADPDLVILVGDFTAPGLAQASMEDRFAVTLGLSAFARLEANLGAVAVLGPRDAAYGEQSVSRDLEDAGVAVLWNRSVTVERPGAPFMIGGWAPGTEANPALTAQGGAPGSTILAVGTGPATSEASVDHADLTIVADPTCFARWRCPALARMPGRVLATAGLAGGGVSPPSVTLLTLRGANPS